MYGHLTENDIAIPINPQDLVGATKDIQVVRTPQGHTLHLLTEQHDVFQLDLPSESLHIGNIPRLIHREINSIISVMCKGKVQLILGTNHGLKIDGDIFPPTRGMQIEKVIMDSESPLLLVVANGKLYAIPMTNEFELTELFPLNTEIAKTQQILSGPGLRKGVLVTSWVREENGLLYHHQINPAQLPIPANRDSSVLI